MTRYTSGLQGERIAEEYLVRMGMTVLARRYRGADGEIDLILQAGDTLVFAEVKARPNSHTGDGLSAVTPAKQRRMIHAAETFLVDREWMDRCIRFDVIEITLDGILHIPNAFTLQG